jgi:hypothetical protein
MWRMAAGVVAGFGGAHGESATPTAGRNTAAAPRVDWGSVWLIKML